MPNRREPWTRGAAKAVDGRIKRKTVVDLAVEALRDKIVSGEYAEGAPLRQDAVAAALGVSRIPVREALRQLEAEGLVTFSPHCGAVVSTLSLEEIQELFELRALLEGDLIRLAVPRLSEETLQQADTILEAYDEAFKAGRVADWGALNWRFHSTLLSPAGRPTRMGVLFNLHNQSDRYTRMQIALTHGEHRAALEHRAIAAAARRRDVEGTHRLLTEHIISSGDALIDWLREQRATEPGQRKSGSPEGLKRGLGNVGREGETGVKPPSLPPRRS